MQQNQKRKFQELNQKPNKKDKNQKQNNIVQNILKGGQQKIKNNYHGFIPKKDWQIETVSSDIDPKEFFNLYVSQRKPVLIVEKDQQNPVFPMLKWTKEHMKEIAGENEVFIEKRDSNKEQFGTGKTKVQMKFSEYLDINEDKDKYYMTTQKIPYDNIGPKYLSESPITQLLDPKDYKLPIIGNLIPNQFNTWMGFSGKQGSSTGLHHDYHDNIYVLIKGQKRFTISCPVNAPELPTNGGIEKVHGNGLITYNTDINSDGHYSDSEDSADDLDTECPATIKKRIIEIEQQIENKKSEDKVNQEDIDRLEYELDELMEKQLDFAFQGKDIVDDFDEDEEEPLQEDPDNFVIPKLQQKDLSKICNMYAVDIKEGQMLYLPSSWYHQVSSFGDFHFAFNIWMHPPNNLKSFENPYKTDYWKKRYEIMEKNNLIEREKKLKKKN